jgi:predicted glycogen debranching enzyme
MSYIQFDKNKLINLEYSLTKELLRTNRAGGYACTTLVGCNTRKYHGLLVVPQPAVDDELHVLLSGIDETVIQHNAEFNLAVRKYKGGVYVPKGHKYLREFDSEPIPQLIYSVGGVVLKKERLFCTETERFLIRYTLLDAHSPTILRFKPFLAYRNRHRLSKANIFVDRKYESIENGIKLRMYQGYSWLHIQFSKPCEYTHVPDWYYDIEYDQEKQRGYDCHEDLYVPGFFDLPIEKGESIIISASTEIVSTSQLKRQFNSEIKGRIQRNSFENCLANAARQFLVKRKEKTEIIAGFPWFGRWGRDTFISLPGLTLALDDAKTCKSVIDTLTEELKGPLFPNVGAGAQTNYNSVDAPMWFFWSLQQYAYHTLTVNKIWKEYGKRMRMILEGYRNGTDYNIHMLPNGLIWAGEAGKALTWMDAIADGKPVTPRVGIPVEISALWYNAIRFSMECAEAAGDTAFVQEWKPIADGIPAAFVDTFWNKDKGYLADYVNGEYKDWSMRPNQIIATSLHYSPLSEAKCKVVLDYVRQDLLTSRGMRTLSPNHPEYQGTYAGDQSSRDKSYHQGTIWPWLFGHFAEGYLKVHQRSGVGLIRSVYESFEETIHEHGIGSISEIYEADPPHRPEGAISQAWSVSELLRVKQLLDKYEQS